MSNAEVTKKMVTFWASAVDAMLQDFQNTLLNPEATQQQKAVAIAKVAQLSILMFQWFNAGIAGVGPSAEDKAVCLKACEKVKDMCEKHIAEVDRQLDEGPATIRNIKLLN